MSRHERPPIDPELALERARQATDRKDREIRDAYPYGQQASSSAEQLARHPELHIVTRADIGQQEERT